MLTYARMADEESITTCNAFFQDGQLKGFSGLVSQSSVSGLATSMSCSVVESFPSSPSSSPCCFSVLSIVNNIHQLYHHSSIQRPNSYYIYHNGLSIHSRVQIQPQKSIGVLEERHCCPAGLFIQFPRVFW